EFVPPLDLVFNELVLEDYVEGALEDWAKGAVTFDGRRFAHVSDASMREDVVIPVYTENKRGEKVMIDDWPEELWVLPEPTSGSLEKPDKATFADDAVIRYPGDSRHTLCFSDENVLLEAIFTTEAGLTNAGLMGKFDGTSGYRLHINGRGQAEFQLASGGRVASVASTVAVNDGALYHVIAEADRDQGSMRVYVNGVEAGSATGAPSPEHSIDTQADFLVGTTHDNRFFKGTIDSMRVAQGTLVQSRTSIDELYTWFIDGPWRRDMLGNKPRGRRDAGAIERVD
ncbi:MAG: LamG domain-containing protein, partial [Pirellulaceae bacterium]